jgi:hypothetical protein
MVRGLDFTGRAKERAPATFGVGKAKDEGLIGR